MYVVESESMCNTAQYIITIFTVYLFTRVHTEELTVMPLKLHKD